MKISTKGRYGLRAMVDMALNSKGDYVSLKSIAEREDISENYLEQVFSTLRKANLVKSIRGSQGGYMLCDNPDKITVGKILTALEGELSITGDNIIDGENGKTIEDCIRSTVWDSVNNNIKTVLDSLTLQDIVDEYNFRENGFIFEYII